MLMADRRVVLVTGASSGIGFATAALFAARGYRTFGTARELGAHPAPKDVEMVKLDVREDDSMNAAVDAVLGTAGQIDILVNNAGFGLAGAIEETSLDEARGQLWNLRATNTRLMFYDPAFAERLDAERSQWKDYL
jgi:NAD(P)-dependent dehydrogenase (short-subunit alcohol dehydrogenase family)